MTTSLWRHQMYINGKVVPLYDINVLFNRLSEKLLHPNIGKRATLSNNNYEATHSTTWSTKMLSACCPPVTTHILIICQLYSFVMGEEHVLNMFVLQAVELWNMIINITLCAPANPRQSCTTSSMCLSLSIEN